MIRMIPPVIVLALGLGAAPASAQPAPALAAVPDGSTAERTLEQNRRVLMVLPTSSELRVTAGGREAPARGDQARVAPASGNARLDLAAGGKAGVRQQ